MRFLRPMAGYTLWDKKRSSDIREQLGIFNINDKLMQYKIREDIQRMDNNRLPKKFKLQTWRENKYRKTTNGMGRWFPGGRNSPRGRTLMDDKLGKHYFREESTAWQMNFKHSYYFCLVLTSKYTDQQCILFGINILDFRNIRTKINILQDFVPVAAWSWSGCSIL